MRSCRAAVLLRFGSAVLASAQSPPIIDVQAQPASGSPAHSVLGEPLPQDRALPPFEFLDLDSPNALAQPQSLTACFESDIDMWGYDVNIAPAIEPTAEACQNHCMQVVGCEFFTFVAEDGGCYVKSSDAGRQVQAGSVSGPRACSAPASQAAAAIQPLGVDAAQYVEPFTAGSEVVESMPPVELESMPTDESVAMPTLDQLGLGDSSSWLGPSGDNAVVDVPAFPLGPNGVGLGDLDLESMPVLIPTTTMPVLIPTTTTTTHPRIKPETIRTTTTTTEEGEVTFPPTTIETTTTTTRRLTLPPEPTLTPLPVSTVTLTTEPGTPAPEITTSTRRSNNPDDPPLLECDLNCYGEDTIGPVAEPIDLGNGGDADAGTPAATVEDCRKLCIDNFEAGGDCEAIVYGTGTCWGKKNVYTSRCQPGQQDGMVLEFLTKMQFGTCAVLGDPHILSFDNLWGDTEDNTQLEHGDYNLVETSDLLIMGRFGYTKRFASASSTIGIAASGSYMGNGKLRMTWSGEDENDPNPGWKVTWNDLEILQNCPNSYQEGVLDASCGDMDPTMFHKAARHTIGGLDGLKPSYLFKIDPDLQIYVLVGSGESEDMMNVVITLRRPDGEIDGLCGNFDCIPADDTMPKLKERGVGQQEDIADSSFAGGPGYLHYQDHPKGTVPSLETCDPTIKEQAEVSCAAAGVMKNSCILDMCAESPAGEINRAQVNNGYRFAGLITIPGWMQGILGVVLVGLFVAGVTLGRPSRRRHHRLYELASIDEVTERESSRTVRMGLLGEEETMADYFRTSIFNRLRASAASALVVSSSATAAPAGWSDEEEDLLQSVAFEHDPL